MTYKTPHKIPTVHLAKLLHTPGFMIEYETDGRRYGFGRCMVAYCRSRHARYALRAQQTASFQTVVRTVGMSSVPLCTDHIAETFAIMFGGTKEKC